MLFEKPVDSLDHMGKVRNKVDRVKLRKQATGPTKLKNISGDGRTYFLIGYLKIRYAKNLVC